MPAFGTVDRFDAQRRAWIAHHQGWSTIQRRRAEQLDRRIRARQRMRSSAAPDPHDDTSLPPWWLRPSHSPAAQVEAWVILAALIVVPLGLAGGYLVKAVITRLIPDTLRGYPVLALSWVAAGLGGLTVLLDAVAVQPEASLAQIVVPPWACLQIVAVPATAAVLGIAEGWWAVPASRAWFPRVPPPQPLSSAEAAEILGGYDLTGPAVVPARRLNESGERTR